MPRADSSCSPRGSSWNTLPPHFQVLDLFNLNLFELVPFGCVMPYNFYGSLVAQTCSICVTVGLLAACGHVLGRNGKLKESSTCFSASFIVLFLTYPGTSTRIFQTFLCDTLDDKIDGSDRFLRADLSIDCNAPE